MFDQLVESEPQGADFKNRRRYFMVSSVVVGILFTTAVVISIFAADFGLGNGNLEVVEMIAPVAPDAAEPEVRQQRTPAANTSTSQSSVPTRQINMACVDEPTIAPTAVSTTPNSNLARPNMDRFVPGRFDSNQGTSGAVGRETGDTGNNSSTLGETIAKADKPEPEETTPPPPAIKKPEPRKTIVSKGVLNGAAKDLPKPNYSAIARQVGAQGQVSVQVTIDETGRVISANAVSGHILLRPEAERAARIARFSPTLLSDVPVKVTGVITYNFVK
ncbi:MAG: energy transducer TonB [Pyrinomonadaceae bacterium]